MLACCFESRDIDFTLKLVDHILKYLRRLIQVKRDILSSILSHNWTIIEFKLLKSFLVKSSICYSQII